MAAVLSIARIRRAVSRCSSRLTPDRRTKFRDLSLLPAERRFARSRILQVYSSDDNIGNYLPVLGIQKMLDASLDTWCIHHRAIDFDFINAHYSGVILGGAGLLHPCFEHFWVTCAKRCRLPLIIWGVGVCFNDDSLAARQRVAVDRAVVRDIAANAAMINVRDDITVAHYQLENATIAPCPTVAYLHPMRQSGRRTGRIVFATHDDLVSTSEHDRLAHELAAAGCVTTRTSNVQSRSEGLHDIVRQRYLGANAVVTTRLHGAIIAYALGIPYVALARDEKLRAFHRLFGNGCCIETPEQVSEAIRRACNLNVRPVALGAVEEFGQRAGQWVKHVSGAA